MKYKVICPGCLAVIALVPSSCSGDVNGVPEPYHSPAATLDSEGALSKSEQQRTPVLTPGEPLSPHDLWKAWSFEPSFLIPLLLTIVIYGGGTRVIWQRRYETAIERIKYSQIKTRWSGAEMLRARWNRPIISLAQKIVFDMNEIDPALAMVKR